MGERYHHRKRKMKIVLLTHPTFMHSKSMPRFAAMLKSGYEKLGYDVSTLSPSPLFFKLGKWLPKIAKWLGYIDQYIIFPARLRILFAVKKPRNTVFVFCDQALGPWVPILKKYPHVIHVHDLLALKSALGYEKTNKTSWSGILYQKYIRKGFEQGKNFISISKKTKQDLQSLSNINPIVSEVIYNGLNYPYLPLPKNTVENIFETNSIKLSHKAYLFNIGGNQWYKNRLGLFYLYQHYVRRCDVCLPLVIVGPPANNEEKAVIDKIREFDKSADVVFYSDIGVELLNALYSGARCLLFPSHEEGFGWPIIEAQACGTCVLTTDSAPMNEIAGKHSLLFSSTEGFRDGHIDDWAHENAKKLLDFLRLDEYSTQQLEQKCTDWAANFSEDNTLKAYLSVYEKSMEQHRQS